MDTLQFEAVKVAIKQDKTGYVLTLNVHPDDIPVALMRDFVGARYQTVMVRLNDANEPMNRDKENFDPVRLAAILCRDKQFQSYLTGLGLIFEETEDETTEWLKADLVISSRAEIRNNPKAIQRLNEINEGFKLWKRSA